MLSRAKKKCIPDPGGKKAPDPDPQHCRNHIITIKYYRDKWMQG
jgi:hypothetical protein